MTKEEYIKKEKDILERAIKNTFKDDPVEIDLDPVKPYRYIKPNMVERTKKESCYCLLCRNKTFFVSHIKPRTIICSECFVEKYIDSNVIICTKRVI